MSRQQSNLKQGPTMQNKGKSMAKNISKKDKTNFKSTNSDKHMDVVKHGDQIATPKE
jgi:hypothetical protein